MRTHFVRNELSTIPAIALLLCLLGGCHSTSTASFTNVSDAWLDVAYFVERAAPEPENFIEVPRGTGEFLGGGYLQVPPGSTVNYPLSRNANYDTNVQTRIHIKVQPVAPSWEASPRQYWLELMTRPPVTIVATGPVGGLEFLSGNGRLAAVPQYELEQGQYIEPMPARSSGR